MVKLNSTLLWLQLFGAVTCSKSNLALGMLWQLFLSGETNLLKSFQIVATILVLGVSVFILPSLTPSLLLQTEWKEAMAIS